MWEIYFFGLWKKAGHTISIYEKPLIIYLWCNKPFSVFMELHEERMISIFPCMKIEWLEFLVNSGHQRHNQQSSITTVSLRGLSRCPISSMTHIKRPNCVLCELLSESSTIRFFNRSDKTFTCLKTCLWIPETYAHQIVHISNAQFGLVMQTRFKKIILEHDYF